MGAYESQSYIPTKKCQGNMFQRLKSKSLYIWNSNEHLKINFKKSNPSANILNLYKLH